MKTLIEIKLRLLLLLSLTGCWQVQATQLQSDIEGNSVNVMVKDIDYPAQFVEKELDSGLPNTINIFVTMMSGSEVVYGFSVNYHVVYDLWDEVYVLKQQTSKGVNLTKTFRSKSLLLSYMQRFEQKAFYLVDDLAKHKALMLTAQVVVNPVETERIKKIQAWIANSKGFEAKLDSNNKLQVVSNSPTGSVAARAATGSGPRFQKLFDNILAQYMNSDELPALWRSKKVTIDLKTYDKSQRH